MRCNHIATPRQNPPPATACRVGLRVGLLITAASLLVGPGCYSPDLPAEPFRCAATGKACPDDYVCDRDRKPATCVKQLPIDSGIVPDRGPETKDSAIRVDGALVQPASGCVDRASEPNNSADTAFPLRTTGLLTDWEICYPGDVDHYAIALEAGQKLTVEVLFKHSAGDLEAALIDPKGFIVLASRSETDNEEIRLNRADPAGTYILVVWGFDGAIGKYDLLIRIE